jgi:hypothetical protein
MGNLHHTFSQANVPDQTRAVILESLEKRWAKSGQDAFIAAVYLNPFFRHRLFNQSEPALRPLGLYPMLKRLFNRVFPHETLCVGDFLKSKEAYAVGKGIFSDEDMCLQELEGQSNTNVSTAYICNLEVPKAICRVLA